MSWRVALIWGTVIVAVLSGVLAAAYLLIQNFVFGRMGWGRFVARTPDETHPRICTPEKRPQDSHMDGTGLRFEAMEHGGAPRPSN